MNDICLIFKVLREIWT